MSYSIYPENYILRKLLKEIDMLLPFDTYKLSRHDIDNFINQKIRSLFDNKYNITCEEFNFILNSKLECRNYGIDIALEYLYPLKQEEFNQNNTLISVRHAISNNLEITNEKKLWMITCVFNNDLTYDQQNEILCFLYDPKILELLVNCQEFLDRIFYDGKYPIPYHEYSKSHIMNTQNKNKYIFRIEIVI